MKPNAADLFGDMADSNDERDDSDDDSPDSGDDMPEKDELPPDFAAHAAKALGTDDPEAIQALYDAIESCQGGGKGLDVVIGMGKPKGK